MTRLEVKASQTIDVELTPASVETLCSSLVRHGRPRALGAGDLQAVRPEIGEQTGKSEPRPSNTPKRGQRMSAMYQEIPQSGRGALTVGRQSCVPVPEPVPDLEDTLDLLARVKTDDQSAWEAILNRYLRPLKRIAHRHRLSCYVRSVSDTDDLVQDALLKTIGRLRTFRVSTPWCIAGVSPPGGHQWRRRRGAQMRATREARIVRRWSARPLSFAARVGSRQGRNGAIPRRSSPVEAARSPADRAEAATPLDV